MTKKSIPNRHSCFACIGDDSSCLAASDIKWDPWVPFTHPYPSSAVLFCTSSHNIGTSKGAIKIMARTTMTKDSIPNGSSCFAWIWDGSSCLAPSGMKWYRRVPFSHPYPTSAVVFCTSSHDIGTSKGVITIMARTTMPKDSIPNGSSCFAWIGDGFHDHALHYHLHWCIGL